MSKRVFIKGTDIIVVGTHERLEAVSVVHAEASGDAPVEGTTGVHYTGETDRWDNTQVSQRGPRGGLVWVAEDGTLHPDAEVEVREVSA